MARFRLHSTKQDLVQRALDRTLSPIRALSRGSSSRHKGPARSHQTPSKQPSGAQPGSFKTKRSKDNDKKTKRQKEPFSGLHPGNNVTRQIPVCQRPPREYIHLFDFPDRLIWEFLHFNLNFLEFLQSFLPHLSISLLYVPPSQRPLCSPPPIYFIVVLSPFLTRIMSRTEGDQKAQLRDHRLV